MTFIFGVAAKPSPDWWALLGPASTIGIALLGWVLVERFARERERRNDLRLLLANVSESIVRISADAFAFYSLAGSDPKASALAQSLKSKLQTLSEHIKTLRHGGMELKTDAEFILLRREITGGSFESLIRPACPADAQKFHQISSAAEDLNLKIQAEFYRRLIAK